MIAKIPSRPSPSDRMLAIFGSNPIFHCVDDCNVGKIATNLYLLSGVIQLNDAEIGNAEYLIDDDDVDDYDDVDDIIIN